MYDKNCDVLLEMARSFEAKHGIPISDCIRIVSDTEKTIALHRIADKLTQITIELREEG